MSFLIRCFFSSLMLHQVKQSVTLEVQFLSNAEFHVEMSRYACPCFSPRIKDWRSLSHKTFQECSKRSKKTCYIFFITNYTNNYIIWTAKAFSKYNWHCLLILQDKLSWTSEDCNNFIWAIYFVLLTDVCVLPQKVCVLLLLRFAFSYLGEGGFVF